MNRIAILALAALAGCGDQAAEEKAAAEAKAKAVAAEKAKLLDDALALNTRCYAAIKWQEKFLDSPVPRSITGGAAPFLGYYRTMIANKLGDQVVPAQAPKPELSKANLDAYLAWAATDQIENNLGQGDRAQAQATFTTCVQSAAEFGTGTMAKLSPAERLGRIQELRQIMTATGS
ncbi:hypothetical protein OK349_08660 [Sphingomonas sp. BT-65]|uniref:hypothetical protein n=1 Tax=Sphingomonas sp. BT-65 TaxID=2989821 RepID=UPI00223621FA|nr:hypothetical protein [Sphingomonas sp. BT-65]MCW4461779.1 hypothetical protein [Sphingomonas sp. BT-65]